MTTPRLPENWEELTTNYAFGNLSTQEAEIVERLLMADPELQTDLLQLQEAVALLPYALPQSTPPPALRSAILTAAQTDAVAARPIVHRRERWLRIGGAIVAVLLVALAVDNYRLRQQLQNQLQNREQDQVQALLHQPDTQVYALKGTSNTTARGSVLFSASQQEALVAVQDLPTLPAGQTYRLWALTAAGQVFFVGQFDTHAGSPTIEPLTIAQHPDPAVAELRITRELASTPLTPRGEAVMTSVL